MSSTATSLDDGKYMKRMFSDFYYCVKPAIPRWLQIAIRKKLVATKVNSYRHIWPIEEAASKPPETWGGWPGGKRFAFVVTHDVETEIGCNRCTELMELDRGYGIRSSFNFVPMRYKVPAGLRRVLVDNGFEVGVHDLYHDGKLYSSRKIFNDRAKQINHFLEEWGAVGFRSGAMHHKLDWLHGLKIEYDASTFDTDPFEPQPDGISTIFPMYVFSESEKKGYVELPYTLPQDSTLFILMQERNIEVWQRKLDWIAEHGGMALFISHPDYMNFGQRRNKVGEYPVTYYRQFLEYVQNKYSGQYWGALPKDLASFWAANYGPYGKRISSAVKTHSWR